MFDCGLATADVRILIVMICYKGIIADSIKGLISGWAGRRPGGRAGWAEGRVDGRTGGEREMGLAGGWESWPLGAAGLGSNRVQATARRDTRREPVCSTGMELNAD